VTFIVGVLCFVIAGTALVLDFRGTRRLARQRLGSQRPTGQEPTRQDPAEQTPLRSRRTGRARRPTLYESAKRRISDKIKEYRKATP
jgi:hypothetical protein